MGAINLPKVTGWGTDVIRDALYQKSSDNKQKEQSIVNALLQKAQGGGLDENAYGVIGKAMGPEVAEAARKTNTAAQQQNEMDLQEKKLQMQNLKLQQTASAVKMREQYLDTAKKLYDEGDRDAARAAVETANKYSQLLNVAPTSPVALEDSTNLKKYTNTTSREIVKNNVYGLTLDSGDDAILGVRAMINNYAGTYNKDTDKVVVKQWEERIKGLETQKKKIAEEERNKQTKIEEEGRAQKAQIASEERNAKVKMTNPKNGRTVDIPANQQARFEKMGWELGGRSENKPDTVINVDNTIQKQQAEDKAKMISPGFRAGVAKDVRANNGDEWDLADRAGKDALVLKEADRRVKTTYPDAVYGNGDQGLGWYIETGDGHKKVVPWSK